MWFVMYTLTYDNSHQTLLLMKTLRWLNACGLFLHHLKHWHFVERCYWTEFKQIKGQSLEKEAC